MPILKNGKYSYLFYGTLAIKAWIMNRGRTTCVSTLVQNDQGQPLKMTAIILVMLVLLGLC